MRSPDEPSLSFSKLGHYAACPHQYWLHHIEKVQPIRPDALRIGGVIHRLLERYVRHLLKQGFSKDENTCLAMLEREIKQEPVAIHGACRALATTIGASSALLPEGCYDNRSVMVEYKAALHSKGGLVPWDHPKAWFRFIMDLAWLEDDGETLIIRDWKTNRMVKSQQEVMQDVQLQLYAWAALQLPICSKVTKVCAYLYYVRYHHEVGAIWPRELTLRARDQLLRWSHDIRKDRDFEPRIGRACEGCIVRHECKAFQSILTKQSIPETVALSNAHEAAGLYVAMGTARRVLGQRLRDHIESYGPVDFEDGQSLNIWADEFYEVVDLAGLIRHLDEVMGVDRLKIWNSMKIDRRDVEGLIRSVGLHAKQAHALTSQLYEQFGRLKLRPKLEIRARETPKPEHPRHSRSQPR